MNATERGDLAERLLPIAAGLACVAHGDGDERDMGHILAQLDQAERDALIVVLAGLVDPDAVLAEVLGYVTWDEDGRRAEPTASRETLRDIAVHRPAPSGVHGLLVAEKKAAARVRFHLYGERQRDIGAHLGVNERTVMRWVGKPEVAA